MKKLNLLLLLAFFAGVTLNAATQYCNQSVQTTINRTDISVNATVERVTGTNKVLLKFKSDTISGISAGSTFQSWGNGVWKNKDDAVGNFSQNWTQSGNVFSKEFEFSTYPTDGVGRIYVLFDLKSELGTPVVAGFYLENVDLNAVCGPVKTPSDLAVNLDSYELQKNTNVTISRNSGTLYYTTSSTGAVSFSSSNSSVATVNSSGEVNAVATGTAVITINQAADDTYAAGSKQITITVVKDPSEIEWSGWINQGAEGTRDQYKNQFKYELNVGATINQMEDHNSVPTLYVFFAAEILSSSPSFEKLGGGMWMPLSTFTEKITTITVSLGGSLQKDCTFRIYNDKGTETPDCGECFQVTF